MFKDECLCLKVLAYTLLEHFILDGSTQSGNRERCEVHASAFNNLNVQLRKSNLNTRNFPHVNTDVTLGL